MSLMFGGVCCEMYAGKLNVKTKSRFARGWPGHVMSSLARRGLE